MEHITSNGKTLAYIVPGTLVPQKTVFATPPDLELQVGYIVYPMGGVIAPHRHVPIQRSIERTSEVIIVKSGRCHVELYNEEGDLVITRELSIGDVLIVVSGGHGFRMEEDTVLLEVKQGPYYGKNEKTILR